jgi:hypothetical protein
MDPAVRREIARKGGRMAHHLKRAHVWTHEEAQAAGRKGGLASRGGRPARAPLPPTDVPLPFDPPVVPTSAAMRAKLASARTQLDARR